MVKYAAGIIIVAIFGFAFFLHSPQLADIEVHEENLVGNYTSPDRTHILKIYYNGGMLFHTDVSYVGVLTNTQTGRSVNLFVASANLGTVSWLDDEHMIVQNRQLAIVETFDFRYDQ